MANVSLCTVCVILIVLYKPEALCLNIDRNLCLETIIKFMHDEHKCGFYYEHADERLKDYDVRCETKCQVTINDIYIFKNSLKKVELGFGYEIYEYEPCRSTNMYIRALNMNITCLAWNKVKVRIGGYCKQNEQCHGSENSGVCEHHRCVCKTGYILSNFECHEGNLSSNQPCSFNEQCAGSPYASCLGGKCSCIEGYTAEDSNFCVQRNLTLNQSCSFNEQCAGSPYASCLGGKCSCIEGYTAKDSTHCVQSQKSILPKFQHKEEANVGTTLGALFGGLLLGVIFTTAAVVIIYRRSKTYVNKREDLNVNFSDDDVACGSAKVVDPNASQNIQTKNEQREVSPYSGSEETSMHNNVYEKLRNGQTQNDVHNHLYEKLK